MAVAFPIGAGVGFIVGGIVEFAAHRSGPVTFLLMGSGLLAGAVVTAGLAYRRMVDLQHEALARAGKAKSTRRPAAAKPILLAGIGGLFLSSFWPLIDRAREGEVGLGPYSLSVLFVAGIALSGYILNLFFMNLPVEGEPIEMLQYFKDSFGSHVPGFVGGVLWCLGLVAVLIATAPMLPLPLNPALSYTLSHAGVLLVMFWGALVWKELAGADGRVKLLEVLTALLLAGGIVVVAVAPLYARIAG
jgi:glucose uptake protein